MTVTAKRLFSPAQITSTAVSYYAAPANTRTIIRKMVFTNTDTISHTVTVYIVPYGQIPLDSNTLIVSKTIIGGKAWECFEAEGLVLSPGDSIQALASANMAITFMASGVEIT